MHKIITWEKRWDDVNSHSHSHSRFYAVTETDDETHDDDDYNHLNKSWSDCVIHPKIKALRFSLLTYRCNVTHWLYFIIQWYRFSFFLYCHFLFLLRTRTRTCIECAHKFQRKKKQQKSHFKTSSLLKSSAHARVTRLHCKRLDTENYNSKNEIKQKRKSTGMMMMMMRTTKDKGNTTQLLTLCAYMEE